jgi:signal transduction histidine kinase
MISVSERRRMHDPETNLRMATYAASLARLARSHLHELRGSLNTLNLNLNLIETSAGDDASLRFRKEHYLDRIREALEKHGRTLETWFEGLSPLEERAGPFDLREIVQKTVAMLKPFSAETFRSLEVDLPAEAVPIDGDRNGWRQVLLANALAALENSVSRGVVRLSLSSNGARAALSLEYREPDRLDDRQAPLAATAPEEPAEFRVARSHLQAQGGRFSASGQGRDQRIQFDVPLARSTT